MFPNKVIELLEDTKRNRKRPLKPGIMGFVSDLEERNKWSKQPKGSATQLTATKEANSPSGFWLNSPEAGTYNK